MAGPIMNFIFPGNSDGIEILKYLSLSVPLIVVTQTTTSILQGVGLYMIPVINLFVGCIVKIVLTMTFVSMPSFNIYGAVIASIGAYLVTTILNIIAVKVKLKGDIDIYNNFIKPGYAACAMIVAVILSYNYLYRNTLSNSISCLLSISLGVIIYAVAIFLLKVFKIDDVKNRIRTRI